MTAASTATQGAGQARGPGWRRGLLFALGALLLFIAAVPRIVLARRPGLWADEIFSLAMATGHSLEHPAAMARPSMGDFVEPRDIVSRSVLVSYTRHDSAESNEMRRVVRAVFVSDTSPPLYYLLLSGWTRAFGTSDAALRLLSAAAAIACLPLLWLVGFRVAGAATAWIASALFAVSPLALYYSAEGRMYALLWLLTLLLVWPALVLRDTGARALPLLLFITAGAAGLLTHYFFAFPWMATLAWLWLHPGRLRRTHVVAAAVVTGLLILPWYLHVPASLQQWRITDGWLNYRMSPRQMVTAPFSLVWSMISGNGIWGASRRGPWLAGALYAVALAAALRGGSRRLLSSSRTLPWLWLAASVAGPVVFDVLRGTFTSLIPRYALPGLPAALIILAMAIAALPTAARVATVALVAVAWSPGLRDVFASPSRPREPFPVVADELAGWTASASVPGGDIVIVQSIPSGLIGVARYLRAPLPLVSWIVQFPRADADADMRRLTAGRRRVAFVKIHYLSLPAASQQWLDRNAFLTRRRWMSSVAEIRYYELDAPPPGRPPPISAAPRATAAFPRV